MKIWLLWLLCMNFKFCFALGWCGCYIGFVVMISTVLFGFRLGLFIFRFYLCLLCRVCCCNVDDWFSYFMIPILDVFWILRILFGGCWFDFPGACVWIVFVAWVCLLLFGYCVEFRGWFCFRLGGLV